MIKYEFMMNFFINFFSVLHYLLLLIIKGLNLNLFSHVAIGKTLISSMGKMYTDFQKYFQFTIFMSNLEKDFPQIKFVVNESMISPD